MCYVLSNYVLSLSVNPGSQPAVEMSQANCDLMRNWASSFGAAVGQRTVRQETTMATHGTLPEFMYQRRCVISDEPLELTTLPSGQNSEESTLDHLNEEVNDEEIADEFDPNSDEEVELSVPRGNWKLCYFSPWCTISIWQSCSLQQSFLVLKKERKKV